MAVKKSVNDVLVHHVLCFFVHICSLKSYITHVDMLVDDLLLTVVFAKDHVPKPGSAHRGKLCPYWPRMHFWDSHVH